MKRTLLACLFVLAPTVSFAADLPPLAKASPLFATPYNGSGMYFGLEAGGGASTADVSGIPGVNPSSLVSAQGLAGVIVGYSTPMANGQRYGFVEADVGANNINGNSQGFSLSGPVTIQILAGFGAPASQIMSFLPTFGIVSPTLPLPGGATVSDQSIYLAGGVDISDVSANFGGASNRVWQFAPLFAMGIEGKVSTGGVLGARIEEVFQMDGTCIGAICRDAAMLTRAKVLYKF